MRFSIIIPIYNVAPYLDACLQSVVGQAFADWEAILVNDGSTDSSGRIAKQWAEREPRFRLFEQPNRGLSAARNSGIEAAQGDYLLFLDSDDQLAADALSTISDQLVDEDLLCFGMAMGDKISLPHAGAYSTGWDYYNARVLLSEAQPFVCVVQRAYRRAYINSHALRFHEGLLHEDNHFTPRACLEAGRTKVIAASHPLYSYTQREGSIMHARSLRNREAYLWIANDLAALFSQRKGIRRNVVYRIITHHYQTAFAGATRKEKQHLRQQVNWRLYYIVSRTRLRHRLNYWLIRLCLK